MVIPMEHLWLVRWSVRGGSSLHDPGNHYILRVTFVPASTAILLFQGPSIDECLTTRETFGSGLQCAQDFANSLDPSIWRG